MSHVHSRYRHEIQVYLANPLTRSWPWLKMAFAFGLGVIACGMLVVMTP